LRREFFTAAHSPAAHAVETSGFDKAGGESWRLSEVGVLILPISHHGRA
jgi:hypothetical protein